MGKTGLFIYVIYAAMILAAGYYVYNKATNIQDPTSLRSTINDLNDVLNENN